MSFLNGLSSFASSLSDLSGAALKDEETRIRTPLLTSSPPREASLESTPDAPDAPVPARPGTTPTHAAGVPADYLPFYQAASKRTGIPIEVLIAQAKQESDFNPDAVGSAGEIGLHQIKPSTAASPGWGLKGIDPATLRDPAANINFAADYLRARAGHDVDFSDPAAVDAALARFNGGGDKNYVSNVRRHMGVA